MTDVLQNVQNAAARLPFGYGRRQSGLQKAMREKLHWLRITDRINYKLCLLVYKALHGHWSGAGVSTRTVHPGIK